MISPGSRVSVGSLLCPQTVTVLLDVGIKPCGGPDLVLIVGNAVFPVSCRIRQLVPSTFVRRNIKFADKRLNRLG